MLTIVQLTGVKHNPTVKLELPRVFLGDPIKLRFQLKRQTDGRTDLLEVDSLFRVTAVGVDASVAPPRQVVSVESSTGTSPVWRSVKKPVTDTRKLPPARFPRTPI